MKNIEFKVLPQEGAEKEMMAISGLRFAMTINGETFNICLEQPGEKTVALKLKCIGRVTLKVDDIVLICPAEELNSKKSNNKRIVVDHKYTDEICDFSARKDFIKKFGDAMENFVEIDRAVWVNAKYITGLTTNNEVVVKYNDIEGKEKTEKLPVSRSHRSAVKRLLNNM